MGTKFKEITLSFIGNVGPKTERVRKEVDDEVDIIGCTEKPDRPCQLIAPLNLLIKDLPGDKVLSSRFRFQFDFEHLERRTLTCFQSPACLE